MTNISSIQNPRIKQAARLRSRRGRQQQNRILVYGLREISRALAADIEPLELFVCRELLSEPQLAALTGELARSNRRPTFITQAVFHHLAFGDREDGAVLVAAHPDLSLNRIQVRPDSLLAVLENVEKPGNLGAIARTADAAGVTALVVTGSGTDVFNPNAIRASLGAVFHLPVASASSAEALQWLGRERVTLYAARVDADRSYTAIEFRFPAAIALGSEAEGLSTAWHDPAITTLRLPMLGIVDSLNVSVTAGVLFYEAMRQRARRAT